METGLLDAQALNMIEKLLIHGDHCPACGRDNVTLVEETLGVCASEYCDGVLAMHILKNSVR